MKKDFHGDELSKRNPTQMEDHAFPSSMPPGFATYTGPQGMSKFEYAVFSALNGLCARSYPLAAIPRDAVDVARKTIEEMNK